MRVVKNQKDIDNIFGQLLYSKDQMIFLKTIRNFKFFFPSRPLLHVSFINDDELVVVEQPWRETIQKLPQTLYRKRYGM